MIGKDEVEAGVLFLSKAPPAATASGIAVGDSYCPRPTCRALRTAVWSMVILIAALGPASARTKRVLVVHSFGNAAPPFTVHSIAFETALKEKLGDRVDLDEVSLDMARSADPPLQDAIVQYLQKRESTWQPDVVVPIGSPAAIFVARYRDAIFPSAAVVYTSLDRRLLPSDALKKNAAYIGQEFKIPQLIDDMLAIAPQTKNIGVIVGASPLEKHWEDMFRRDTAPYRDRLNFTYFSDLPFDQMLDRAAKMPPNSFLFLLLLLRDAAGVTHDADEGLRRFHAVANAPINSIFQHQLGLGIVGGRLYQSERVGVDAAEVTARILSGEPAANFPPQLIEPFPSRYDWRELRRWKIDEKRLPAGSTVFFRQPTWWQQHPGWLTAGISLLTVQALLISALLANLFRRRRAEGSLAESEKRFRSMAEAAPVMIWMSGTDKLCTYFNRGWLEFTGRKMEQELGAGWAENVHADDFQRCLSTYVTAFDARKDFTMQYRLRRADGEYRWITDSGKPRFRSDKTFAGYVGACTDINDSLEQRKALNEIEQRIALATEAAHMGVWELNLQTNVIWANEQLRKLFAFPSDDLLTYERFEERIHPEDRLKRKVLIDEAISSLGSYHSDYRIILPDGSVRWIAGRGKCSPGPDGKPARLLGAAMDVTRQNEMEQEAIVRRQQVELLSRVSLLGEMTASLAHELNQPLAAIVSNANAGMRFIDRGKIDLAALRDILDDTAADGLRAHEIINKVRTTIKKGNAVRHPLSINEVVTRVAHLLRPDAVARSCQVWFELGEQLPTVVGDQIQIEQVLTNLISNAFDAMADILPDQRIVQVSTGLNGNGIQVNVRDHGPGISTETGSRLFDQFFTTKDDGLGMGLAIVRSIVEAHGGKIDAANAPDGAGGACFHFTLPAWNDNGNR